MLALGDVDPAVVVALLDHVDLVAAVRAELGFPQLAGHGIDRQAERVAVAGGPDLRLVALLADERVVLGDRPSALMRMILPKSLSGSAPSRRSCGRRW